MKMRVAFLAYYPAALLRGKIALEDEAIQHPTSWVVNLAEALSRFPDVDLHIVAEAMNISYDQDVNAGNLSFHFVTSPRTLNLSTLYIRNIRRLIGTLKKITPDIVHAHGFEGSNALAGVYSGFPCLVSVQGVLTECVNAQKKWLGRASFRLRLLSRIERHVARRGKYFGTRTEFDSAFVRRMNPTATTFYTPEAVNELYFHVRPTKATKRIVFLGLLYDIKDLSTLMKAMHLVVKQDPEAQLAVIGYGTNGYVDQLKREADDLRIRSAVTFLGFQTPHQIAATFRESAVLVQPSIIENSPNSIAEAMCAGLPVVATKVGGIPSLVEDGVTGILVPPRDPERMARAVIRLLLDADLRTQMGNAAREKARTVHTPSIVAEKMMNIYKKILALQHGERQVPAK